MKKFKIMNLKRKIKFRIFSFVIQIKFKNHNKLELWILNFILNLIQTPHYIFLISMLFILIYPNLNNTLYHLTIV